MRLAWATAIFGQILLGASLWRNGRRDWWTAYLALATCGDLFLWSMETHSHRYYDWYCLVEVVLALARIAAVAQITRGTRGLGWGILLGVGALLWSLELTSPAWPTGRRAILLFSQAVSYGCTGALLAAWRDSWMLAYFGVNSAWLVAQQIAITRMRVETVSTVFMGLVALLTVIWAIKEFRRGKV